MIDVQSLASAIYIYSYIQDLVDIVVEEDIVVYTRIYKIILKRTLFRRDKY